jgi:hypothetical protein
MDYPQHPFHNSTIRVAKKDVPKTTIIFFVKLYAIAPTIKNNNTALNSYNIMYLYSERNAIAATIIKVILLVKILLLNILLLNILFKVNVNVCV